jgi:adenosylcobyric acid synthase
MMFEELIDTEGVESNHTKIKGFGRIKGDVLFQTNKILTKGCYNLFGVICNGYEIHNGTTKKRAKSSKNFYGTFVHGIFENDELRQKIFNEINPSYKGYNFQNYKQNAIADFAQHINKQIDIHYILERLNGN